MVEGEDDLHNFGGRIYREAGRLAALVNDILTLSNLDEAERATEGEAVPIGSTEPIELSRAIYAVEQRLEQVARQANVTISHETKPVVIEGVSRLIDELIYNLASNAIRYNRPAVRLRCSAAPTTKAIRSSRSPTRESVSRLKNRARYLSGSIAWTRVGPRYAAEFRPLRGRASRRLPWWQ